MPTKNKLPQEHFSKMGYARWRKQRGLRLVVSISPLNSKEKIATCGFEGKNFVATGKTNIEALDNLFEIIRDESNLDTT